MATHRCHIPNLVPIGPAVVEKKTFKVVNIIENCPKYIESTIILHDQFGFDLASMMNSTEVARPRVTCPSCPNDDTGDTQGTHRGHTAEPRQRCFQLYLAAVAAAPDLDSNTIGNLLSTFSICFSLSGVPDGWGFQFGDYSIGP